jgi:hypothetical protein
MDFLAPQRATYRVRSEFSFFTKVDLFLEFSMLQCRHILFSQNGPNPIGTGCTLHIHVRAALSSGYRTIGKCKSMDVVNRVNIIVEAYAYCKFGNKTSAPYF